MPSDIIAPQLTERMREMTLTFGRVVVSPLFLPVHLLEVKYKRA